MNSNLSSIYKLYFDDIEEIFLNEISFKYLFISTIITCLSTIFSLILLLYKSTTIFLSFLIPLIYSLIFYDFLQLLSIILLKYNLLDPNDNTFFSQLCRWPYYLKASSEAGQCITLIFIYLLRKQKVQYFLKHHHLPNSGHIHSRALTFVCLLFIVYANNWITHIKVERNHLVTKNHLNNEVNIQEHRMEYYGLNDVQLNNREQFYIDFTKYAENYGKTSITQIKPTKIILNQKDDSTHEILIKIPYKLLSQRNLTTKTNKTQRKSRKNRPILTTTNKTSSGNNSYRIQRCTYGQRNFLLTNLWSLIHSIFYFFIICYFTTTIYRYKIPRMTINYHQTLHNRELSYGHKKAAQRHKQLILLTHLRRFQYIIVYCYTIFILIRLIYICLLTIFLCLFHSPLKIFYIKKIFYSMFVIVYYSIPIRMTILFIYLFLSLFSSYISSIFYHIFCTKLHFSCKFQKPTIRFHLHIVQYNREKMNHDHQHSSKSLVFDIPSSICDEHSTVFPTDSIGIFEENSVNLQTTTTATITNDFVIINEFEHSKL